MFDANVASPKAAKISRHGIPFEHAVNRRRKQESPKLTLGASKWAIVATLIVFLCIVVLFPRGLLSRRGAAPVEPEVRLEG